MPVTSFSVLIPSAEQMSGQLCTVVRPLTVSERQPAAVKLLTEATVSWLHVVTDAKSRFAASERHHAMVDKVTAGMCPSADK